MKKTYSFIFILIFLGCSDINFVYNGLLCPTDDISLIRRDLQECHVYDINDIEKSINKDKVCRICLEKKGYLFKILDLENNASK